MKVFENNLLESLILPSGVLGLFNKFWGFSPYQQITILAYCNLFDQAMQTPQYLVKWF